MTVEERAFDGGSRPEFWLSHVRAGVILTELACTLVLVYVLAEPGLEHRRTLLVLLGLVMASTGAILLLPLREVVAHPRASWFFYSWSAAAASLATAGALLSGGARSPLISLYFIMLVYAATAYPPQALARVAFLVVGLYLALALRDATDLGSSALVAGSLALTAWMSSIASRNQWHQLQEQTALARVDGLTGCLNHRAFREVLDAEVERAHRLGHPLSVLLIDLDEFKQVNDEEGHLAGDARLRRTGVLLRNAVRRIDSVGRIGGDEFAVLLIESDLAQAMHVGERVCEGARAVAGDARSSVSVGVALLSDDDTATTFLREADAALYDAKRAGRDQVRCRTCGDLA